MNTNDLDELGVDLCAAGLVPWRAIGLPERTEVVHRLTALRLSAREIAERLEICPRTVCRHRSLRRDHQAEPPPPAPSPEPERTTPMPHTIEEIRATAENLIADMQSCPDLNQVRENCLTIAGSDPLLAAQVMMALASWIPLDATPKWLQKNEDMLVAERNAFALELVG